ncbi:MAG: putative porin [Candidatus Zixiibacteriota bacterium]
MRQQIKRMGAAAAVLTLATVFPPAAQADNWWEKIKVKGDLRYRHEMLDFGDKDPRNRQRIRARLGFFGEASPYTKIGIQLSTGTGDPVSTNQTLDDGFSNKRVGLDLAYFEATHPKLPGLAVTGGKFYNPFFKPGHSELIWDSDWNPEGGVVRYDRDLESVSLLFVGSGLWIDERSSGDDSYLAAGQAMARVRLNEKNSSLAFGAAYYNYVNTQGFQPFFDPGDAMGNSVVELDDDGETVLLFASDYDLIEVFGEFTHELNAVPMTVMADFVTNTAADSLETGWLVGVNIGKAKKAGSVDFRYIYRNVEADAVVGIFTDSDFRDGGTDGKGHELGGSVQLADNTTLSLSYFINDFGLETETPLDFNRLQVDLQLKF